MSACCKFIVFVVIVVVLIFMIVCGLVIYSVFHPGRHDVEQTSNSCQTDECMETSVRMRSMLNISIDPCVNFYDYACGGWIANHSFKSVMYEEAISDTKDIINDKLKDIIYNNRSTLDSFTKGAKVLVHRCLETRSAERELVEALRKLGNWPWDKPSNKTISVSDALVELASRRIFIFFAIDTRYYADYKRFIVQLTLAKTFYNYQSSSATLNLIGGHQRKVKQLFSRLFCHPICYQDYELVSKQVLDFESLLFKTLKQPGDKPSAAYIESFTDDVSTVLNLSAYRHKVLTSLDESDFIVLRKREALNKIIELLSVTDENTILNYITFRVVTEHAQFMGDKIRFNFRSGDHRTQEEKCMETVRLKYPRTITHAYLNYTFPPRRKKNITEIVDYIREAYDKSIKESTRISEKTKRLAREKLSKTKVLVAYAENFLDQSLADSEVLSEPLSPSDSFIDMLWRVNKQSLQNLLSISLKSQEELFLPDIVNIEAIHYHNANTIALLAGVTEKFIFSESLPMSYNFGSLGFIIGHEFMHGFDMKGQHYDAIGSYVNWWSDKSDKKFERVEGCFERQYAEYTLPFIDVKLNGKYTEAENMADNAGLRHAFLAYEEYRSEHEDELTLPHLTFTHNQLFFVSFAQHFCSRESKQYVDKYHKHDIHALNRLRVIGSVSNSPQFAEAFNCPIESPMNPVNKCYVW